MVCQNVYLLTSNQDRGLIYPLNPGPTDFSWVGFEGHHFRHVRCLEHDQAPNYF